MTDIPKTAKVSVLEAPRKMVVHELPIPEIGDDEILVKVEGCGICGTDLLTHKYPLDKMNEAMEMNISMQGLKIAFVPE